MCTRIKNTRFEFYEFNDIPNLFFNDLTNEKFIQFDYGYNSENRYVVFLSETNKLIFSMVETVLIDGTFWCVPKNFTQLLTFNCHIFGKFFPLCFVLLRGKNEEIYQNIFHKILSIANCQFKNIIIDFEYGLKNAVEKIFVSANIHGCSFHFGKNIWRKLQNLNLTSQYSNSLKFRNFIRMLLNFIFIPEEHVKEEFENILKAKNNLCDQNVDELIYYFQKTYIGFENTKPLYPINFWNCHNRVKNNIPRTINCIEAWHRGFNANCNVSHLNLGRFIEILREENEKIRIKLIQARRYVDLTGKNLKREESLRIVLANYKFYKNFEFYEILNVFFDWNFLID